MIIEFSEDGSSRLQDHENFKQFKITAPASLIGKGGLAPHLRELGTVTEDGAHVWVSISGFLSRFGGGFDAAWQHNFEAMIESVAKYGFLNEEKTAVRAHIEAL